MAAPSGPAGVLLLDGASVAADGKQLPDLVAERKDEIRAGLLDHGAVLVRGFASVTEQDFSRAAARLLDTVVRGNGEHEPANDRGDVQTPVAYDAGRRLLWHNENSFNQRWPLVLMFCAQIPAASGGQTPLVDSREVLKRLDPDLVSEFRERGVAYRRRYEAGVGLSWQKVFGTDSRSGVEAICAEQGLEFRWGAGDVLHTTAVRPAVIEHPATGDLSWFNQAQHWHPRCLDEDIREAVLEIYGPDDLPRDCRYGDGTPIEDGVMDQILDAYQALERQFDWASGDVLIVDNILSAHGRNPYTGKRRLLVAMGEEFVFADRAGTAVGKAPSCSA